MNKFYNIPNEAKKRIFAETGRLVNLPAFAVEKEVMAFLFYREGGAIYNGIDKVVCPGKKRIRKSFQALKNIKT